MFQRVYLNYFNNKKEIDKQKEILTQLYLEKDELIQELEHSQENKKCLTDEVQEAINIKDKVIQQIELIEGDILKREAEKIKLSDENSSLNAKNRNLLSIEKNVTYSKALLEMYNQLLDFKSQFEEINHKSNLKPDISLGSTPQLETIDKEYMQMFPEKDIEYKND